ncbi:MAG: signal peptidase I [Actinomycetaceae bacterium]|nr:signal peptidase I [Actinomycetaceae bacterium]
MSSELDPDRFAEAPEVMPPSYPPGKRGTDEDKAEIVDDVDEKPTRGSSVLSLVLEFFTVVAVALLISVILKTFVVQAFEIPSESMENTMIPGDRILVNKLADDEDSLERGDLIVFIDPGNWLGDLPEPERGPFQEKLQIIGQAIGVLPQNSGEHLVKRIIGLPGDHVACCNDVGQLMINGEPINETYIKEGVVPSVENFDVTVPSGHVWVMGDNRSNSQDSRYHQAVEGFGFVPITNIEGRAWLRILPFDRFGRFDDVSDIFAEVPDPQ